MKSSKRLFFSLGLVLALTLIFWTATAQIPDNFTNLKVVPKDIPKKALVDAMKDFTFALGTRCWYCHDGEGDDLSTYDFASDVKPAKEIARRHMVMTQEINKKYFDGQNVVKCNTCHGGLAKPEE